MDSAARENPKARPRGATRTSQTVDAITALIAREGYGTGALLPTERELRARLAVSHTVVREALQILAARGIVSIKRGTGVTVGSLTARPVQDYLSVLLQHDRGTLAELFELRRILEVETAALAAQRATPQDHAAMAQAIHAMRAHSTSPEGYVDADLEFHRLLVAATHNRMFATVLQPISGLLAASRVASFGGHPDATRTVNEHEAILNHVINGNAQGARAAMTMHLDSTEHDIESAVAQDV